MRSTNVKSMELVTKDSDRGRRKVRINRCDHTVRCSEGNSAFVGAIAHLVYVKVPVVLRNGVYGGVI